MRIIIKFILMLFRSLVKLSEQVITIILFNYNRINYDYRFIRNIKGVPFVRNKGTFIIKENAKITTKYSVNPIGGQKLCTFIIKENGILTIDKNAGISNSTIVCWNNIYIGKNVYIGGDCKIYDTDFHSLNVEKRVSGNDNNIKTGPIRIEDGSFIGSGTIILKGVTIGKNSIIGAGSVVSRNIPDNEIWAGNPVRFIRDNPIIP